MRLIVFGLSLTSSWGNGHATVYRGLLKALNRLGAEILFVEKDVPWYAGNRDLADSPFARVQLYSSHPELEEIISRELPRADVVLMGSYFPDGIMLANRLSSISGPLRLYYDIDTPVTLSAFASTGSTQYLLAEQVRLFDAVLSFTGGRALEELTRRWGARSSHAFYCALDGETHHRVPRDLNYACMLSYMGTYSADRHRAWSELFLAPARSLPEARFLLAGPQYPEIDLPPNTVHIHHVAPHDHSALYSSSGFTLNITRGPMAGYGYSPSVRLFEAAGCGTCVVSDPWPGIEEFFSVDSELLIAEDTRQMVEILTRVSDDQASEIGQQALARALRDHTYEARARQFMELVADL